MYRGEFVLLLHLASKSYKQPIIERPMLSSLDFGKLMESAVRNNMLCHAARELFLEDRDLDYKVVLLLKKVIELCDKEIDKIKSAVTVLEDSLDDYVSIKTCKAFPRIPDDLDVYVRDFDRAVSRLKSSLVVLEWNEQLKEALFGSDQIAKIHVHSRIGWAGAVFIDNELLSVRPNRAAFHGLEVTVPNNEAELLINMAHINYEKLSFDITDLLHIYRLAGQVNWEVVQAQIAKHHWKKSFERTAKLLDGIHWTLYADASPFEDLIRGYNGERTIVCSEFPVSFPRSHIAHSFLERRVLTYMLGKVLRSFSKSMRIVLSGRTYEAQGKPPSESEMYRKGLLA